VSTDQQAVEAAIEDHIRSFFASCRVSVLPAVGYGERLPGLRVVEVEPQDDGGIWTYVSLGASWVAPVDEPPMEFVLLAPEQSVRPPQLLRMTAWYHADPDPSHRLGWGHTLPIGEPWLDGSACDVLLVSKPYTIDPAFEVLNVGSTHVHFYWLLPITESEQQYRAKHGLDALEDRFEETGLAYWNPLRRAVA
jgi:hypothetical protein